MCGDVLEPNDTPGPSNWTISLSNNNNATLGVIPAPPTGSSPSDARLYSISKLGDVDNFKIILVTPARVRIDVLPIGSTYGVSAQDPNTGSCSTPAQTLDLLRAANLRLEMLAADGTTVLQLANQRPSGDPERIDIELPPADYYFRVSAETTGFNYAQFYQLEIATTACSTSASRA